MNHALFAVPSWSVVAPGPVLVSYLEMTAGRVGRPTNVFSTLKSAGSAWTLRHTSACTRWSEGRSAWDKRLKMTAGNIRPNERCDD